MHTANVIIQKVPPFHHEFVDPGPLSFPSLELNEAVYGGRNCQNGQRYVKLRQLPKFLDNEVIIPHASCEGVEFPTGGINNSAVGARVEVVVSSGFDAVLAGAVASIES